MEVEGFREKRVKGQRKRLERGGCGKSQKEGKCSLYMLAHGGWPNLIYHTYVEKHSMIEAKSHCARDKRLGF